MTRSITIRRHLLAAASATALCAGAAFAQDATTQTAQANEQAQRGGGIEEIIVTARKRAERLVDVPVSVSALTADAIQVRGIKNLEDLALYTPGLQFQAAATGGGIGRANPQIRLRGVVLQAGTPITQVGAVFIDGTFLSIGSSIYPLTDAAQVEVIKGPQNAYFGRNTFSGAINYITPGRPDEPDYKASVEVSQTDSAGINTKAMATVAGPIIREKVGVRVHINKTDTHGAYKSIDGADMGARDDLGIIGNLYVSPTPDFNVKLLGAVVKAENFDDGIYVPGAACSGTFDRVSVIGQQRITTNAGIRGLAICGEAPGSRDVQKRAQLVIPNPVVPIALGFPAAPGRTLHEWIGTQIFAPEGDVRSDNTLPIAGTRFDMKRAQLNADYTFLGGWTADLALAYNDYTSYSVVGFDSFNNGTFFGVPLWSEDTTIEARLRTPQDWRFRASLGVNKFDGEYGQTGAPIIFLRAPFPPFIGQPAVQNPGATALLEIDSNVLGIFGSADFDITDSLTISGEVRRQNDKITDNANGTVAAPIEQKYKDWMFRGILRYKLADMGNVYASVARGALPGRSNAVFLNASPAVRAALAVQFPGISAFVDSQKMDAYEVGAKLQGDNWLITSAVYHMKWKNQPINTPVFIQLNPPPAPLTPSGNVILSGNSRFWGAEVEAAYQLTEEIEVNATFNWNDAKYTNFLTGGAIARTVGTQFVPGLPPGQNAFSGLDVSGKRIPFVAQFAGTVGAQYTGSWNDREWFLRADVTWQSKRYIDSFNLGYLGSNIRLNLRAGLDLTEWANIQLFANNVLNEDTFETAESFPDQVVPGTFAVNSGMKGTPARPREIGVRLAVDF
jgi:iron complex outermembrane receptor protein